MKKFSFFPAILVRKLVITALIGPACFLFGVVYYLYSKDKIFVCISLIVMVACLFKAAILYLSIRNHKYYELTGACIRVTGNPFGKYKKIRLLDDNLIETELMLKKDSKILIGYRYRFYLMKRPDIGVQLKNEYLMAVMSKDNLLGYENLGEA